MGLPGSPGSELLVFWGSVQMGFIGFEHRPVDYAANTTAPTLVLHGEKDPWATVAEARRIVDNLAGDGELVVFESAGHESLILADEFKWTESVGRWLGLHAGTSEQKLEPAAGSP